MNLAAQTDSDSHRVSSFWVNSTFVDTKFESLWEVLKFRMIVKIIELPNEAARQNQNEQDAYQTSYERSELRLAFVLKLNCYAEQILRLNILLEAPTATPCHCL